ncbi:MAG: hypothetical protein ACR2QI_03885 [Woeseiaceae bacterium]
MAFENTVTEQDLDANARQIVENLRSEGVEIEPDLAVDGLSESILSRLLRLFGIGRD